MGRGCCKRDLDQVGDAGDEEAVERYASTARKGDIKMLSPTRSPNYGADTVQTLQREKLCSPPRRLAASRGTRTDTERLAFIVSRCRVRCLLRRGRPGHDALAEVNPRRGVVDDGLLEPAGDDVPDAVDR